MDVVALGELLIDFTCQDTDADGYPTMAAHPGGAPANFLAALARYGAQTAFIGKVGDDSFGRMLRSTLSRSGIQTDGLVMAEDAFTTLAFVTLDSHGDREFSFARKPGADTQLCTDEINLTLVDRAKVFHFGTLSLTDEPSRSATQYAVSYARKQGKLISFDPNLRRPLWRSESAAREQILWGLSMADIVKISDEEVEFLWQCSAQEGAQRILRKMGAKLVFVTCGANGSWYANKNACGHVDALKNISVRDTTGAGDIFGGSAMWKLLSLGKAPEVLSGEEMRSIVQFACTAAGLSTTHPGGISSVPDLQEISALLPC